MSAVENPSGDSRSHRLSVSVGVSTREEGWLAEVWRGEAADHSMYLYATAPTRDAAVFDLSAQIGGLIERLIDARSKLIAGAK